MTNVPDSIHEPVANTLAGSMREWWKRVKGGEMGSLPAIVAILLLSVIFTWQKSIFFSKINFANLLVQGAELTVITAALVFLIILGEIDLSAGTTGGVGMAAFVVLMKHGWPWGMAFIVALLIGVATGFVIGNVVSRLGVPSFVVSLAFFLGYQGLMLTLLGDGGLFPIKVKFIKSLMNANLSSWLGWLLLVVVIVGWSLMIMWDRSRRTAAGVENGPIAVPAIKVGIVAAIGAVAVWVLNQNRSQTKIRIAGVPRVVPLILLILFLGTFVLDRTRFGRHLYAVGGNPEAARRAGINVATMRIAGFMICSTLAIISGTLHAARITNVESTAGRQIVLSGVGAAVVGGVSLFGGRGRMANAAVGALAFAMIDNGLGLLGRTAGENFMWTGGFLVLAAIVDALARRRKQNVGR